MSDERQGCAPAPGEDALDAARELGRVAWRDGKVLMQNPWLGALPVEANKNHPCYFAWQEGWLAERAPREEPQPPIEEEIPSTPAGAAVRAIERPAAADATRDEGPSTSSG